jgi:hypothetical protein
VIARCFSPDVDCRHLAPLDGRGPFSKFDEAALCGPTAALRAGKLVGYTGWCRGHFPEKLACIDGEFFAEASAADGRATSGCHDPLPWLAACCEQAGGWRPEAGGREELRGDILASGLRSQASGLSAALIDAVRAVLRTHMSVRPGAIEFAHHNAAPGWVFRGDMGTVGHFAHIENALYLYLWTGDLHARAVWFDWLLAVKAARTQFTACDRETHTHFVRCHLAAVHANDAAFDAEAKRLAKLLLQKPLAQHSAGLYHPLWPYYLWQTLRKEAERWLVEAADWSAPIAGTSDLALASIAYWITGKREYLTAKLPALVSWSHGYFRDPGGPLDWHGQCTGRTGDGYAPNQFPIFKRAMIDAGLDDSDLPAHVAENSYPLSGNLTTITGCDLSCGTVRYLSYQGDTHGGRLRAVNAQGKRIEELAFEGPWKSNRARAEYSFTSRPVTRIQALAYEQLLGPLSDDPSEAVLLEAGKTYELGRSRAILETQGEVTIEPVREHVTFYDEQGRPILGIWSGLHKPVAISNTKLRTSTGRFYFDARGGEYARWRFTCSADGVWRVVRK